MELHLHRWESQGPEISKVVLFHGMGGTGGLWRPIAAGLEDRFTVIAPDQRGHGKSRVPRRGAAAAADYTPLRYGEDVVETLERAGVSRALFVGHSMGVRTACAVAHLRPDWVSGLVLVDLGLEGPAGGGLGDTLSKFLGGLPSEFPSRAEAREFLDSRCPDPSIAQYLMAVSVVHGGRLTFPFDHEALLATIEAARASRVRDWVEEAASRGIPVLCLRGELSKVWSREDFERERAGFAARAGAPGRAAVEFREIAGAGHGLPFEKRAEFTAVLRERAAG